MTAMTAPADTALADAWPRSTCCASSTRGAVLHVRLNRPAKRNARQRRARRAAAHRFVNLPVETRAVVLSGEGDHFCAGLDLAEVSERSVAEGIVHSRSWHAAFEQIQFGKRAGRRGAARRGRRRRARARGAAPHSRRRGERVLRPARGPARPLRRRRRLGAHPAPDRRRADGRHDADRPRLRRRRRPRDRRLAVRRRARGRVSPRRSSSPNGSPPTRRSRTSPSCMRCRASPTWRRTRACSSSR